MKQIIRGWALLQSLSSQEFCIRVRWTVQAGSQTADIFSFTLFKYVRNAPTCREPAAVQIQLAVKSKNAADFIFPLHFKQSGPADCEDNSGSSWLCFAI